jgi:hypothetical protein
LAEDRTRKTKGCTRYKPNPLVRKHKYIVNKIKMVVAKSTLRLEIIHVAPATNKIRNRYNKQQFYMSQYNTQSVTYNNTSHADVNITRKVHPCLYFFFYKNISILLTIKMVVMKSTL